MIILHTTLQLEGTDDADSGKVAFCMNRISLVLVFCIHIINDKYPYSSSSSITFLIPSGSIFKAMRYASFHFEECGNRLSCLCISIPTGEVINHHTKAYWLTQAIRIVSVCSFTCTNAFPLRTSYCHRTDTYIYVYIRYEHTFYTFTCDVNANQLYMKQNIIEDHYCPREINAPIVAFSYNWSTHMTHAVSIKPISLMRLYSMIFPAH